jgi:hypothetical protein
MPLIDLFREVNYRGSDPSLVTFLRLEDQGVLD